jgi:hypothetical protein
MSEEKKPFDRSELANCFLCDRGVAHDNNLIFYEVSFGVCAIDLDSVRQQHGLEMMMGAAAPLAAVLSPSTNVAFRFKPTRRLLCMECATKPIPPVALIGEDDE